MDLAGALHLYRLHSNLAARKNFTGVIELFPACLEKSDSFADDSLKVNILDTVNELMNDFSTTSQVRSALHSANV